jgi:hypothetical protein
LLDVLFAFQEIAIMPRGHSRDFPTLKAGITRKDAAKRFIVHAFCPMTTGAATGTITPFLTANSGYKLA